VDIHSGSAVAGLAGDASRVTGVVFTSGQRLDADVVVDCSGRGSRSDRWLGAFGLPAPAVDEVKVGVGYTTRLLHRRPGDLPDGVGVFVVPTAPHEKRVGVLIPIEGDRWLVSLGGWHGEHAPSDEAGFLAHARSLPHPWIAEVLSRAEPLTEPAAMQFPASRWRRFERLTQVPAGYVAMGDAICSFNPVYGQGMTCASLEAHELARSLDRHGDATAAMVRDFYGAAARVIETPWRFAVGADFAFPETSGQRPFGITLVNWYSRRLQIVAQRDSHVRRVFTAVQQLVTPPGALFAPRIAVKVLSRSR
jgi:2-polyprenyl-6-methoxyphenol hydroxylase-like FAD-dependent oxidoreductase